MLVLYVPVVAAVLEGVLVVELVEPLPGLHEGEPAAEADLLLPVSATPTVQRSRTSAKQQQQRGSSGLKLKGFRSR